jgi:hypothetical protein
MVKHSPIVLLDELQDIASWISSNRLQLNLDKLKLLWFTTPRRLSQLPTRTVSPDGYNVMPSSSVRNLGVFFDSDLSLHCHIYVTESHCLAVSADM